MSDRPDWIIVLQADYIKSLEEEKQQLKAESEKHLDDYFKISQKYSKSLQALKEIKVIANRLEQTKIPFAAIAEQIKDKIQEVEDEQVY